MAKVKNATRFKSLDIIEQDDRIQEAFDEGEDGIWVWLRPGFTADPGGAHDIHEWKVRDVLRCIKQIVPCTCNSCLGIPSELP